MELLYLYNEKTRLLHIRDCCPHSIQCDMKPFESEDEALSYAGRAMGICKICAEKRDVILRNYLKQK